MYNNTQSTPPSINSLDVHINNLFKCESVESILEQEKTVINQFGVNNNITSSNKHHYFTLDSDNLDPESTSTKFKWRIQDFNVTDIKGQNNSYFPIKNIIAAKLNMINFANQSTHFIDTIYRRDKYTFYFEEFASQAINLNTTKFQFIAGKMPGDFTYGTNVMLDTFYSNKGWFYFNKPITTLSSLTLTMTNIITNEIYLKNTLLTEIPATLLSNNVVFSPEYKNVNDQVINFPFQSDEKYYPIERKFSPINGIDFINLSPVSNIYKTSGLDSGDAAVDFKFNDREVELRYIPKNFNNVTYAFAFKDQLLQPADINITTALPFMLTLQEPSRFLLKLELICE